MAHLRRAGDLADCCWWLINLAALELADENSQAAAELLEEDLAICEELDLPVELVPACCVLADTTLFEGRFEEAAIWLRRALVLYRRLGRQDSAVADFPNVVCCVARLGNPGDAARLTGAYNAMLSRHVPLEYSFTAENPLRTWNSYDKRGWSRLSCTCARLSVMTTSSCLAVPGRSSATTMPSTSPYE